jgi:hypothetical protein
MANPVELVNSPPIKTLNASAGGPLVGPPPALSRPGGKSMKNRNRAMLSGLVVAVALLLSTWPVAAHHQIVAQFSTSRPITLRGSITKVEWVNPHGWIYLDVKGADGRAETWAVETGSPYNMTKRGLKPADFRFGTEVIIGAFAARDGSRKAAGMVVTFAARETVAGETEASFTLGR